MKYELVMNVSDDCKMQFDVREKTSGKNIGHLILSETGVSWKGKNKREQGTEVAWSDVKTLLTK